MTLLEKATVLHYHRHRVAEHAAGTVEALGYRASDSQVKRFEALVSVGNLNDCLVLDVGCGHGDLKGFLDARFHGFNYVGIDQMTEFVQQARHVYGQRPSCYFCVADFTQAELPRADYVFASGVLGYRCADPGYYFAMIDRLFGAARRGLAFNMLDKEYFPDHPLLVGHDVYEVLEYCRGLAPDAEMLRGYLDDDFTVLMRRGDGE
ncbi:MAG: hypothetical protein COS82_06635 [Zetaproteobacteria bacterium CG06_land_8_20_14_3_00_59_53]|nr:MAG: hypothetical protein AUK36_03560 [Zetaproteobacteria bacterium CG2_30_59_37]PIO89927.1 MAG: hypothetical protein COX56_06030 [Zetaproteobacteria bacterium CG23_combo_of_CG06-09_8_20_14_all_59_86]PIQ64292.1 MAG: hypothetical protein COV97_10285 [Zetaproteobacteria bacterium CG11_big_fil_rev_8_21_14_0_20_59_439]PIU70362.1 MAG: hypothetical protein COS82_06635 [Zetaproteobacteria bacterium CG06_land_8_20_14_3_00_59_53]PIU97515.1 MAG: hypothetical protein COS62_03910 [Zetaproteobacteria bac